MNAPRLIGKVTPEERDAIKRLYERKNSLHELFHSLPDMQRNDVEGTSLYNKLVDDMGKTVSAFKNWWDENGAKYKWPREKGQAWRINFETCEIFLGEHH